MFFTQLEIPGAWLIKLDKKGDERGFFARAYCQKEFAEQGIHFVINQTNISRSTEIGTIRGLHYQVAPHQEAKLLRCIEGEVFDVMVDLRPDSLTYLRWYGHKISATEGEMILIPEGCAHGYQALTSGATVLYSTSAEYAPKYERGIRWNDPKFSIQWPNQPQVIVSDKDNSWPDYSEENT